MPRKTYHIPEDSPTIVTKPAVAYGNDVVRNVAASSEWNPNVPFHCTQEEFLEHIHRIEQGNFTPLEEANKEFEAWKKEYLANRLK